MTVDTTLTLLSWPATLSIVLIIAGGALIAGLIVILARSGKQKDPQASIVRSWIAITLVLGLLILSAATFATNDETLRSTLIGALASSAAGAIAFYFSSNAAEGARRDILNALGTNPTGSTETVPDLTGKTTEQAKAALGVTKLQLNTDSPPADISTPIKSQVPAAGASVAVGTSIQVTYAKKVTVPDISGQTATAAGEKLKSAALGLSNNQPTAPDKTIATQVPTGGSNAWEGSVVSVVYVP